MVMLNMVADGRDLNCGRGHVFGRVAFIAVADITDAIAVTAGCYDILRVYGGSVMEGCGFEGSKGEWLKLRVVVLKEGEGASVGGLRH
ncbi:hypothetical protein GOBAR_AA15859 [Gossypium barbadense]|uniref:Uncharacterized protein n=1 Tax=Gossypium barbadense TaxID=3634 RepID=A0A2P5XNB2_GOSBA|nr:hypothetical protein GOBAR_AA15859 [Gossypium barbadense]